MRNIKKYTNIIIYIGILMFSCIIFFQFIKGHYASDTYTILEMGYKEYVFNYWLKDGRIIMALVGLFAEAINMSSSIFISALTFLGIAISSLTVLMLYNIILKYKKTDRKYVKVLILIISFITIFNFMYMDNIYFVDIFAMSISVLSYILAGYILCERKKFYIIKVMGLLFLGIFSYQATASIFIAFVILFSILKNVNSNNIINKNLISDILRMMAFLIIAILVNYIYIKIVGNLLGINQTRLTGVFYIFDALKYIIKNVLVKTLVETLGLFPKGIFLFFVSLVFVLSVLYNKKYDENYKSALLFFIILMTIISAFSVSLLSATSILSGRMRVVLGMLIGIMYIYMYIKTDILENKTIYRILLILTLIIYFIFGNYIYIKNQYLHIQNNIIEKNEVMSIKEELLEYEKENNVEVKYIGYFDGEISGNSDNIYTNLNNKMVFTQNALRCAWSAKFCLEFYLDREFTQYYEAINKEIYDNFMNSKLDYMFYKDILFIKLYKF